MSKSKVIYDWSHYQFSAWLSKQGHDYITSGKKIYISPRGQRITFVPEEFIYQLYDEFEESKTIWNDIAFFFTRFWWWIRKTVKNLFPL